MGRARAPNGPRQVGSIVCLGLLFASVGCRCVCREREAERGPREADAGRQHTDGAEESLIEEEEDIDDGRNGAEEGRARRRKARRRRLEQEQRGEAEDQREEVEQAERAVSASRIPFPLPLPPSQSRLCLQASSAVKLAAEPHRPRADPIRGAVRTHTPAEQPQQAPRSGPAPSPVGPLPGPVPIGPAGPPIGPSSPTGDVTISLKAMPKAKVEVERRPKTIRPAFVAEEESKSGKRKLVKLDFGADDAEGGGGMDAAQAARNAAAAAAQLINERRAGAGSTATAAERAKRLIEKVPKDKEALYALPVDWKLLEARAVLQNKMKPWIAKKVTEYFGETDETVISFVMEEVRANPDQRARCLCHRVLFSRIVDLFCSWRSTHARSRWWRTSGPFWRAIVTIS